MWCGDPLLLSTTHKDRVDLQGLCVHVIYISSYTLVTLAMLMFRLQALGVVSVSVAHWGPMSGRLLPWKNQRIWTILEKLY